MTKGQGHFSHTLNIDQMLHVHTNRTFCTAEHEALCLHPFNIFLELLFSNRGSKQLSDWLGETAPLIGCVLQLWHLIGLGKSSAYGLSCLPGTAGNTGEFQNGGPPIFSVAPPTLFM